VTATLRTSRTDRVASLFVPSRATLAAERALDGQIRALVTDFLRARHVAAPADLAALAETFADSELPEEPVTPRQHVEHLAANVVPYSNRIASPRSLAHMNQGLPYFMRPLARLLTAMNQNLTKLDASRALSLCERQALAMMHRLVYDFAGRFYERHVQNSDSTLGIVTSGGTVANITALWAARNASLGPRGDFGGVEREGLTAALRHHGHTDAVVIGPESMHYSFTKAAGLLGIGERGLIRVPADYRGRMDLVALRQTVAACRARGIHVIAVVGVAGSTDAGAIDPLTEIADIADEAHTHFHVDAAWGGPLLFSDEYRSQLAGIERADSVTIDGHKQLYLPLGIGLVLFRQPQLARAIEKHAHYLSRPSSADLGKRSLEGSRPGTALYLHAALNIIGRDGYAALVNDSIRKVRHMADTICVRPDFELLMKPDSNVILYRYLPEACRMNVLSGDLSADQNQALNRLNERVHKAQRQAGRTYVSRTTLFNTRYGRGVPVVSFRAVVANPLTSEGDLAAVLEDQRTLAAVIEERQAASGQTLGQG
jgi:putative pyridoxal-dependent aspartate 1-decarboxylase